MNLEPRKPKFKGMTVITVGYIDINLIDKFARKNKARKKGVNSNEVVKFEILIKNEVYEPWYNIPPVVVKLPNGIFELVAGEHRFHAHKGQKKTKIWVAIVEFDTISNKLIYQSIENKLNTTYVATPRTLDDIVNSAVTVLKEEGYVDGKLPTNNAVWSVVNKLEIYTEECKKVDVFEEVKKEIGATTKDVQTYSSKTGIEVAAEINDNDSTPYSVELYKNVSGKTSDTDIRLFFKILTAKKSDPSLDYNVYAHWSRVDGNKIVEARNNKLEFWKTIEKNIVEFAKVLNSPDYISPNLKPLPQIEDDDV